MQRARRLCAAGAHQPRVRPPWRR